MFMFDSSAIIEIAKGNDAVMQKYEASTLMTINLVYGEVYLYHLRAELTEESFKEIPFVLVNFSIEDIEESMKLLHKHKKITKDFSFIDAVVYTVAKKNNLTLVTKDFGFKGLSQVEFIVN